MKKYLRLLRVKHYIKNTIVFMPLFFGGKIFDKSLLLTSFIGFCAFCLVSSAVYINNDCRDIEKDRKHPTKKMRPLASGEVSMRTAKGLMVICLFVAVGILMLIKSVGGAVCLALYMTINILYSWKLKNVPIVDVTILAMGFVIRVFFGGYITGIEISSWLFLVITTGSLYMGLGKRKKELKLNADTRGVLQHYGEAFLDKNMYVCVALTDVFYALWTLDMPNRKISWTIPFFIIILMCYSLDIEGNYDGDPVEVILKDKKLIILALIYVVSVFVLLYY